MRRHFLSIMFVIIVSSSLYSNTLKNSFVYDDESTITSNTMIKELNNLPKLLKKEYFLSSGEMSYRPVVTLTYFLDYAIYGPKPWGYHFTNILLHTVNGILLYIFLTLIIQPLPVNNRLSALCFLSDNIPLLVSLLFITHPILTEAVNAISFREDLLVYMFYMTTLILYIKLRTCSTFTTSSVIYILSCFSYLLALLSKEMAVTLPLIIYSYEWIYRNKRNALKNLYNIGYIALTIGYIYLRFYYFYNPAEGHMPSWSLAERLITAPWLFLSYLKLVMLPVSLSASYDILPANLPLFVSSLSIIVFVLVMTCLIRKKAITFGILFFIVTLIPVYNIVPISKLVAERYLYLPTLGFVICFVSVIYHLILENVNSRHNIRFCVFVAILLILGLNSWSVLARNTVWRDANSLWADTIRKAPDNSIVHNDMGAAYIDQNKLDKAIQEFKTALQINPKNSMAHHNLGFVYYKQGRFDEAIIEYSSALKLKPNSSLIHNNLGNTYYVQGRFEEALQEYLKAAAMAPNDPNPHTNIGNIYLGQGRLEEALRQYEAALKLNPDFIDAHYGLGRLYMIRGLKSRAKKEFESVLSLKPDFLPARKAIDAI